MKGHLTKMRFLNDYTANFRTEEVDGYWANRKGKRVFVKQYGRKGDEKKRGNALKAGATTLGVGASVVGVGILGKAAGVKLAQKRWDDASFSRASMINKRAAEVTLPQIKDPNKVVILMGGIRQNGKGSEKLAEAFKKTFNDPDYTYITLNNKDLDLPNKPIDKNIASDMLDVFAGNVINKGYNQDSIDIAAYSEAVFKKTGVRPKIVGYSAGGVAAQAAVADLEKMGAKDLRLITIGSPYVGVTKIDTKNTELLRISNSDDNVANLGSFGKRDNLSVVQRVKPKGVKEDPILAGHAMNSYINSPKSWKQITSFLQEGYSYWG